MGTTVRSALLISFVLTNGITVLQFGSSLILARLLTPKEIGIYSIAAAIVSIAQLFRNVGVSSYLVGEATLTAEKIRAAFGIQLVVSWFLATVVFAASGLVADIYREPGVRQVMMVSAISFLLAPFGGITITLLLREMKYRERAVVDISSAVVHAGLSVILAYAGHGYMSLAWAALGNTVTTTFVSLLFRPAGMPWTPDFREARNVLNFSLPTAGADILRYAKTVMPELIVGRMISFEAVAFLSRATSLVGLFYSVLGQGIGRVAFAYFPQEQRSGSDLRALYIRTASYMCATAWPFFAVLGLLADPVVSVLFGSQWVSSIPLVQILAFSASISVPFLLVNYILNATGRTRAILTIDASMFFLTTAAIIPAARFSNEAVAIALTFVSLAYGLICLRQLHRALKVTVLDLFEATRKAIPVSLCSSMAPAFLMYSGLVSQPWLMLVLSGLGAAVGWVAGILLFKPPLRDELVRALKVLKSRRAGEQ